MNAAMEMLRSKAAELWYQIAGEEDIKLEIDSITPEETIVATMKVEKNSKVAKTLSEGFTEAHNKYVDLGLDQLNLLTKEQSRSRVWIYNISPVEFTVNGSLFKNLNIPACVDSEYSVVTSLPVVMALPITDLEAGVINYIPMDGRRIAMDLINPSNLGLDQDWKFNGNNAWAIGNNLSERGVFFSTHNPPLKKDLKAAHKRLKAYYQDLVEKANIVRLMPAALALGVRYAELSNAEKYLKTQETQ
jgi:hypothetical protein